MTDYPDINVKKFNLTTIIILFFMTLISLPVYSETKGVYILCYHAFVEKKDPYSCTEEQFKDQLLKLKKSGFTFVKFEDVISNNINGNKNILITIDDGNKSVYSTYYSVMKPLGIKPLLGIYPAIIGRMKYAMTWDEIKQLAADGCYIASHGYHHMYFSTKYYQKEPESFRKEIYYSKKVLEEKLGRKIDTMVYPFGVSSDIAIAELKNAGYKHALSLIQKMERIPVADPFLIPRYMITKPNHKGIIAYITKNSEQLNAADGTSAPVVSNQPADDREKVTINNYPQRISKMVMNDIIFMPDKKSPDKKVAEKKTTAKKTAAKKNPPKFKPYVEKSAMKESADKNARKQSLLQQKPDDRKENKPLAKQTSLLSEIKDAYFALHSGFSRMIYSFRETTFNKIAVIKIKAFSLFS